MGNLIGDQIARQISVVVNQAGTADLIANTDSNLRIRVIGYYITADAAETITFKSGTGGTAITGVFDIGAQGGVEHIEGMAPPGGWLFECAAGVDLEVTQGGSVNIDGWLLYELNPTHGDNTEGAGFGPTSS
jgi:hypothetical protein